MGVSQNQPPRSSCIHSLRICRVASDSPQLFFFHSYLRFISFLSPNQPRALKCLFDRAAFTNELFSSNFCFLYCFFFPFCTTHLSCVSTLHASTPLHHGFGLDFGRRCERLRLVCLCGAAQRLLEQHKPKVNISLNFYSPMLIQST